jgi:hypothetical protein
VCRTHASCTERLLAFGRHPCFHEATLAHLPRRCRSAGGLGIQPSSNNMIEPRSPLQGMVNTLDHACRAACPAALGVARMGSKSEPDAVLDDVALPSFKKRIWARFTEDCNYSHIGNVLTAAWGEQRAIFKEAPVVHPPCCATWPLLATCVYLPRHANVVCACHTMPIWCVCVSAIPCNDARRSGMSAARTGGMTTA